MDTFALYSNLRIKLFWSISCYSYMAQYKIRDLETLTGIKAHTIRIWEKRYNLLEPVRTDTNLRLYSDRELQDILLVNLLNQNGYKISKIADLSREERIRRANQIHEALSPDKGINKLIYALVEMDEQAFDQIIAKLVEEHGIEDTFTLYLVPFLERIGVMWLTDSISVAQEHFISMLIRQRLTVEIDKLNYCIDGSSKAALLYLPENEWHDIGLLYYYFILKKYGWKVYYLGQSTPIEGVREVCHRKKIDLIVSAWVSCFELDYIKSHFKELRTFYDGKVALGGAQAKALEEFDVITIEKMHDLKQIIDSFQE
jgi:MerR family transcriptional regulator, light-induced transcriptional regulator